MNMFKLFGKKEKEHMPKRMWHNEQLTDKERSIYKDAFNQITGEDFIQIQKERLTPYLKSLGFKGSKNNFYKHNSPWIHVIQIFKDHYGGSCALNVGVHLDYIENQLGNLIVPSKFRLEDAMIDKNIEMDNGNGWYYYGLTHEEGCETIDIMIDAFERKGIPFLEKYESYPHPFSDITFDDILNPSERFLEYEIPLRLLKSPHFRMFLAKVNMDIDKKELAIKILEKVRNDEYYSSRFIKPGCSPLIQTIDSLLDKFR